jgi:hypothetical protein
MASKEIRLFKQLAVVTLECLGSAVLCFPTSLAKSTNTSTAILTDMLLSELTFITSSASLLTTQLKGEGGATKEKSFEDTCISRLIFEVAETVLLSCGPLLPSNVRDLFEISVGQGLSCLVKGVSLGQYQDKRIKRTPCALLRQDPYLQKAFLSLAITEFISSSRNGVLSGNAPLLRKAAELCLNQPDVGITARRILMVLETVIVPSAVPIPCVPMHIIAKVSLEKQRTENGSGDRHTFNDTKTSIFSVNSSVPSTIIESSSSSSSSDNKHQPNNNNNNNNNNNKSVTEKNKKRTKNDEQKSVNKEAKRVKVHTPPLPLSSSLSSDIIADKGVVNTKTTTTNNDSSDDDIPDIVM